eukprot:m.14661 g.14661  ORF g.14661 m.14661 type:complete len:60 (-) comp6391_c0_seq1:936-1115(-)
MLHFGSLVYVDERHKQRPPETSEVFHTVLRQAAFELSSSLGNGWLARQVGVLRGSPDTF